MADQSCSCIFSVLGGKNSNETWIGTCVLVGNGATRSCTSATDSFPEQSSDPGVDACGPCNDFANCRCSNKFEEPQPTVPKERRNADVSFFSLPGMILEPPPQQTINRASAWVCCLPKGVSGREINSACDAPLARVAPWLARAP